MNKKINLFKNSNPSYIKSSNFFESVKYALNGIIYCLRYSRNFRIQITLALLSIIFAIFFNFNQSQFLILIATITSVLILEILNTALESLVDLVVGKKFASLAKISKDCSAAAVLLASANSIFVALYLFLPKIKLLILNF